MSGAEILSLIGIIIGLAVLVANSGSSERGFRYKLNIDSGSI